MEELGVLVPHLDLTHRRMYHHEIPYFWSKNAILLVKEISVIKHFEVVENSLIKHVGLSANSDQTFHRKNVL